MNPARHRLAWTGLTLAMLCSACTAPRPSALEVPAEKGADGVSAVQRYTWLNRLTWGATPTLMAQTAGQSPQRFLDQQLHPAQDRMPAAVQAQLDAMTVSQRALPDLVRELEARRKAAEALANDDEKKAAQQSYQQELTRLAREAASRHLLRALYSPQQLREQMSWFWLNHFSVFQYKGNLRALLADYEDSAIRPHALGRFRDLLGAVATHPAMLRYLDNEQNAAGRINENFARELMELHTLGVDGGYSQSDVQELARVLTGIGISLDPGLPKMRRELQPMYLRRGLFEFNPARHDFGDKRLLGQPIHGQGMAEFEEALDRLARHPATARFISRQLAQYWLADDPAPALVQRMSQTFLDSDGDIAATLSTLFNSSEFKLGAGRKFKDPMRYVVSALRLAYDGKTIVNTGPILNWLNRMGEPLYGRPTPDGYPSTEAAWASPGQMATRFEIAKAIGSGSAGLFRTEGAPASERPAFPQLSNALYFEAIRTSLSPDTRAALEQATSAQEWNSFLLSSPEMMRR